jgi:biopolymer transport protein ExbD
MAFQKPRDWGVDPGSNGYDDRSTSIFAEINITPLTDVILVLLIIFMVSSSAMVDAIREGKLDVNLPKSTTEGAKPAEETTLPIGILADGRLVVGSKTVSDQDFLNELQQMRQSKPNQMILVDADGSVQHRRVVEVLETLRKVGFNNVGIGTQIQQ